MKKRISLNPRIQVLEALKNLAPRKGSGITSITISSNIDGEKREVVLTPDDRKRMEDKIKRIKEVDETT